MIHKVLILGTDHRFQSRSPEFTDRQHQQFAAYITATASDNGVNAIAEENNAEALAEAEVAESTVQTLARELGLKHRYCDPNMQTRAELGIRQENQIRISAFPKQLTEAEVRQRLEEAMYARECYWQSELLKFDTWPVLFICGAEHSLRFLNLLRVNNLDAVLVARDWGA